MNDLRNLRLINNVERNLISKSILKISYNMSKLPNEKGNKLYILLNGGAIKSNYPQIFLASSDVIKTLNLLKEVDKIQFIGIFFGFIKKGEFYLSLEGAEFLFNHGYDSDFKRLRVNEIGEKSILYGNNILKKMIKETPHNLNRNDFFLIFNEINEIIAIAQSQVDNKSIQKLNPDDIIALNLSDKGKYLRRKQ